MKIELELEGYSKYVVQQLVDIKGGDLAEVIRYIVMEWVGEHRDELCFFDIDPDDWNRAVSEISQSKSPFEVLSDREIEKQREEWRKTPMEAVDGRPYWLREKPLVSQDMHKEKSE